MHALASAFMTHCLNVDQHCWFQLTDKLVEKIGVQRTPGANPEMYKSDDYSVHLKGDNQTPGQKEREIAGGSRLRGQDMPSRKHSSMLAAQYAPNLPISSES